MLCLEFDGGVVTVADFQHKPAVLRVDAEIQVLLAAQRTQCATTVIVLLEQRPGLVCIDFRTWQTGTMNQRGERHTTASVVFCGYIAIGRAVKQVDAS
ncbi:hypothetical protein D3C84_445370 [compost metagenome]